MFGRALAVGAIATLLTWVYTVADYISLFLPPLHSSYLPSYLVFPCGYSPACISLIQVLPLLVPLLSGLWAGFTKRSSLPWFSSPRRWLRRGGRSALEIATFTTGMSALVASWEVFVSLLATEGLTFADADFVFFVFFTLVAFAVASLAFMSGALLGNALRRVGLFGTPKELPQGEDEGDQEEVWTARKEARWGLAGTLIAALISALASLGAAYIGN
jgi:hypothetical protein